MSTQRAPADRLRVKPMTPEHAAQVLAIYQAGIDEGDATFETHAPSWAEFDATRMREHRLVAVDPATAADRSAVPGAPVPGSAAPGSAPPGPAAAGSAVLGWVAVSRVSSRKAYAGVVEHSVYVHPLARGTGVGRLLMAELIASTEAAGIWTIQSGVFPENEASIALHLAVGFKVVGTRERIAMQHSRWRDVLLLERRSPLIA